MITEREESAGKTTSAEESLPNGKTMGKPIITDRELMQQALDSLDSDNPDIQLRTAVALRNRMSQPQPLNFTPDVTPEVTPYVIDCLRCGHCCPQRPWTGLTDEEIKSLPSWWPSYEDAPALVELVKDVEAKLREKNEIRNP
jgi:hypothetical protein